MAPTLFDECVEALGGEVKIQSKEDTNKIFDLFESRAPLYKGGSRINWGEIEKKNSIYSPGEIVPSLQELLNKPPSRNVYVFWNDASLPAIQTNWDAAVKHFDDIKCVGFETWFFNPEQNYVVEYYYLGELNIGVLD